ncbi:hypothetical protein C2857_001050 [Epichloe festucae Fl1]|uniref:Secretory lipase n=1 Tax=Epichloe festucae (strain Fl1) TaxID=877507 RepID=A0A7S9PTH4_EPIFF|nr:hypothetical protein C2857_001050 [Epichloe festucae Fl1]
MRPNRALLSAWALALALTARAAPALPSVDPFYAVPDGLEKVSPGTILRHRTPPSRIGSPGRLLKLRSSHQILYRTTDSLRRATATVLTVLVPPNANLSRILSYQVAEDAASINCAPSYALQLGAAANASATAALLDLGNIESALRRGWVVIAPDFLGPRAAFLANELAGNAVLDGVRAAFNSRPFTGIAAEAEAGAGADGPTVVLWGYSGGSLASMWAAELQPAYAPGLRIAGVAAGGAVPNITTVVSTVNGSPFAGLIPSGVLGLAAEYDFDFLIDQHLLPRHRREFYGARDMCLAGDILAYAGRDVVGMFDDRSLVYTHPVAVDILARNALGRRVPGAGTPLYVYKAVGDEISPVGETDRLVDAYCAGGATVQYERVLLSGHALLAVSGAPRALAWIDAVMGGRSTAGFGHRSCKGGRTGRAGRAGRSLEY